MIATKWFRTGLAMLTIGATILLPGLAQAAPTVTAATAFGNVTPEDPLAADPLRGASVVYANSAPFGPGTTGEGLIHFRGTTDPAVDVIVTVDESPDDPATPSISRTVVSDAAGAFNGEVGNSTSVLHVQDLGVHLATTTDSTDPDDTKWGKSTLRVRFVARERTFPFAESLPEDRFITKYAGTPLDNKPPIFGDDHPDPKPSGSKYNTQFPPSMWCHQSALLSASGSGFGASGGGALISCGDRTNPDRSLTGPPPVHTCPTDNFLQISVVKLGSCSGISYAGGAGAECVCGIVFDNYPGAPGRPPGTAGVGSEVSVTITIGGGTLPAPRTYSVPIVREGTRAGFGVPLSINDFEPTWPDRPQYSVTVLAKDAWGKTATKSSNFHVMPF